MRGAGVLGGCRVAVRLTPPHRLCKRIVPSEYPRVRTIGPPLHAHAADAEPHHRMRQVEFLAAVDRVVAGRYVDGYELHSCEYPLWRPDAMLQTTFTDTPKRSASDCVLNRSRNAEALRM